VRHIVTGGVGEGRTVFGRLFFTGFFDLNGFDSGEKNKNNDVGRILAAHISSLWRFNDTRRTFRPTDVFRLIFPQLYDYILFTVFHIQYIGQDQRRKHSTARTVELNVV